MGFCFELKQLRNIKVIHIQLRHSLEPLKPTWEYDLLILMSIGNLLKGKLLYCTVLNIIKSLKRFD